MHHEYAVEPAAVGSSWDAFRYIFEKFGFQKGRLISRFPRTWARLVIETAEQSEVGPLARARIVEKLNQKRRTAFVRTGRDYDPTLGNWVENAAASHAISPFHGIIAQQGAQLGGAAISVADLDDDHPLMVVPTSCDIPRTPKNIADVCFLLLYAAREINLVDPYFNFVGVSQNYRGPLEQMMHALQVAGKTNVHIRIHYRARYAPSSQADILNNPGHWVNVTIPTGYELHLYAWEQRQDGERLHDRFLLCDCGGMTVGTGFSASVVQEKATFALLDDVHAQELRSKFADGATVYTQAERGVRVKSNGGAEFI